jgi:hypothetical protein
MSQYEEKAVVQHDSDLEREAVLHVHESEQDIPVRKKIC